MSTKADARPHHETGTDQADEATVSVTQTPDEWHRRLAEAVAATMARKAAQRAARREFAAARRYGLAARHQAKLRRSGGGRR